MRLDVNPDLALAHAMVRRPGAYVLLLGSGVSRAAKIPTGWQVTLDLCKKLAILAGEKEPADPETWYTEKHGRGPNYSELVEALAPNPSDQKALLAEYFEPKDDDARERGDGMPTAAHHAIARLVRNDLLHIIITTNFDRLMERALEAEGVSPEIIKSTDDLNGMEPLHKKRCVLFKLHGDYQDTRIKNGEEALSSYDKQWDELLDRIFDEYGLVVSGWSADYDKALYDAIKQAPSRRYATLWTSVGMLTENAQAIISARDAEHLEVESADEFFSSLESKTLALMEHDQPAPLTVETAEAEFKRLISQPEKSAVKLHDMLMDEARRAKSALDATFRQASASAQDPDGEFIRSLTDGTIKQLEIIAGLASLASYHGRSSVKAWREALSYLVALDGRPAWGEYQPRRLPATWLLYVIGLTATQSGSYGLLKAV